MFKKFAAGASALALVTALASCSSGEVVEELDKPDVNGLTVSAACEKVRAASWRVEEVRGTENYNEKSDCSDSERKVVKSSYHDWNDGHTVTLYFANEKEAEAILEETPAEEETLVEETPAEEEAPVEEAPSEESSTVESTSGYQAIYDEYSARIQSECPVLSMTECAELSNEGVSKMAEYMYKAKGTDGQYATYQTWAGKLYDVYMASFM